MQLAPLGSLESYIVRRSRPISDAKTRDWMRDIAEAISYLHFLGIAHRTINPRHVLLFAEDKPAKLSLPDAAVEICDPNTNQHARCRSFGSSDCYHAPEAIFGDTVDPFPVDIWAIGATAYFAMVGKPPFTRVKDREAFKLQLAARKWATGEGVENGIKLSEAARSFLAIILRGTIDKRPSIAEDRIRPSFSPKICEPSNLISHSSRIEARDFIKDDMKRLDRCSTSLAENK